MRIKSIWIALVSSGLALSGAGCLPLAAQVLGTSDLPKAKPLGGYSLEVAQAFTPPIVDSGSGLTYQTESFNSTAMGTQRFYGVVLPPGYVEHPYQRYPVVFLLHGGHGEASDWIAKGNALPVLAQLYQTGKLVPSIIITPDGNDKRGSSPYADPQYIDGPNGNVSSLIGDELVRVVQQRYRTLPAPQFWAIGGLSSGAWGAVNVGLHHLDHFSVLFSHSGYFIDKSGPDNSPLHYISTLSPSQRQQVHIYLDTGDSDPFFLRQTTQFHQKLDQLGIANLFNQFSGKHTWRYWHDHLADSLTYVGQQFQQASQTARISLPSLTVSNSHPLPTSLSVPKPSS